MSNLQEYLNGLPPARDRRINARVTPKSLVNVRLSDINGIVHGIVLNVSEAGMALAVDSLPAVGDYPRRIRFQLPVSSQSIETWAQVVWLTESKKGVGVGLVGVTADAHAQISNWIASEKLAGEFEQPRQLLRRNKQPLEIGSRKFRNIFSNLSARDEEAAARFAEMFPSESTYAKIPAPVDENKLQQDSFPIAVRSNADPRDSMLRSAAKISTGDLPQGRSLPQVQLHSEPAAPSAPHIPVAGIGSQVQTAENKSSADGAGDSASHLYIFDLSGLQLAALVFLFAVLGLIIGLAATKASVDVLASLGHGPFGKQVRLRSQTPRTQSASGPASDSAPSVTSTESSSVQSSRSSVDQDSSDGANTVGSSGAPEARSAEGGPNEVTGDSEPSVDVPMTDSNSSATAEPKPSADSEKRPNRNDSARPIARSALPSRVEQVHPSVASSRTRRPRTPASHVAKPATAATPKPTPSTAGLKHPYPAVAVGPTRTAPKSSVAASPKRPRPVVAVGPKGTQSRYAVSHKTKSAVANRPKPSALDTKDDHPAVAAHSKRAVPGNPGPLTPKPATPASPSPAPPATSGPANLAVAASPKETAPGNATSDSAKSPTTAAPKPSPHTNSESANPAVVEGPKDAAPENPAPTSKPPKAAEPKPTLPDFVTIPSKSGKPIKVTFPQEQIASSSSLIITTQRSVVVPPEFEQAGNQASRLKGGKLVSYVLPRNPRPGDRYGAEETVKVHATIGQQGLVTEIKPVSGPIFLLSSTMSAVRLWRYKPTFLNERPIETHQDVTIIFKLPR
jgi:hypothetical protein